MTRPLRLAAIAIAIAGAIDPAITLSGASRPRVAVVALQSATSAADHVRDRLVRDLSPWYEVVPAATSDASAAVVIGHRLPDQPLSDSLLVATVTTPAAVRPGARFVRVDAPREIPPATVIHLDVELEAFGVAGQSTVVTAAIGGLEIARATHRWTSDGERWHGAIEAVPVGDPPYVVRLGLKPDANAVNDAPLQVPGSTGTLADVVVDARPAPLRVEFYDPRPSWATTFVRRALEADARFQIAALSFTSRGISAHTGDAVPPGDPRLDDFEAVIVGGLERLSAAEGRSLERYMRERGGAVVVVPDRRIDAGAARDVISGVSGSLRPEPDLTERLLEQPATLTVTPPAASLQASELLVLGALPPGADVIARLPGAGAPAVIASVPRGDGRLLLSGAMDAWRFRAADNGAFDRFWQSTIAGLALAVPPPIAIRVDPPLLRPGEPADVTVRIRSRDVAAVSASIDRQPIRLLPEPEEGVYRGRFVAKDAAGSSTLEVVASSLSGAPDSNGPGLRRASRTVLIRPGAQHVRSSAPSLAMLSSSHHGIDVTPEHVADLEAFLRGAVASPRVPRVRHPMRSTWWILPFVLCLSAEWWLRRRRGLR